METNEHDPLAMPGHPRSCQPLEPEKKPRVVPSNTQPAMSKTDYSKWDNIADSDDEKEKGKPAAASAPAPAAKSAPSSAPPPSGGFFSDDDPRAEVEKLKAKKRLEKAERAAAAAANPQPAAATAAPAPAPAPVAAAVAPWTPAEKVVAAESTMELMLKEMSALALDLPAEKTDPVLAAAGAAKHRLVSLTGEVGRLQNMVDDISIGEIEDEVVREEMRGRRKKVNRWLEEEAGSAIQKLKKL